MEYNIHSDAIQWQIWKSINAVLFNFQSFQDIDI